MSVISNNQDSPAPLKIGITGGIGSGKTTACRIFAAMGIPIYYADERAKDLMVNNLTVVAKLKSLFGKNAYLPDGRLHRQHISAIVFNNKKMLEKLNAIVHPAVHEDGIAWQIAQKNVPYTIKEAALLFETSSDKALDKVITVFAPKEVRLERVIARDESNRAAVEARMDKQMDDFKKMHLADFVIFNDGKRPLIPQIHRLHQRILKLI
ncbi:MAG: dephospho-CoA kinase [Saprospiraceae bacterium]|jgi:dephospho-CoA kinase